MRSIYKKSGERTYSFAEQVYAMPYLSDEETNRLISLAQAGDIEAQNKVIQSSLRYVLNYISNVYQIGQDVLGAQILDDLIQAGAEGLIKAIKRFDATKKVKFQTYAASWIKKEVSLSFDSNASGLTQSTYYKRINRKKVKFQADFQRRYQREPDEKEIMEHLNMTEKVFRSILQNLEGPEICEITPAVEDALESVNSNTAEEAMMNYGMQRMHEKLEILLNPDEFQIISYMMGLEDDVIHPNYSEVAEHFGITKQAVGKQLVKIRGILLENGLVGTAYEVSGMKPCKKAVACIQKEYMEKHSEEIDESEALQYAKDQNREKEQLLKEIEEVLKMFHQSKRQKPFIEMEEDGASVEEFAKNYFGGKDRGKAGA